MFWAAPQSWISLPTMDWLQGVLSDDHVNLAEDLESRKILEKNTQPALNIRVDWVANLFSTAMRHPSEI